MTKAEYTEAVCPGCGKNFALPFVPQPGLPKPYCSDCTQNKKHIQEVLDALEQSLPLETDVKRKADLEEQIIRYKAKLIPRF